MHNDKNIDPLNDIDFGAMGVMTQFEGGDPETPPAPEPEKDPKEDPKDDPKDPNPNPDPKDDPENDDDPKEDPEDSKEDPEDPNKDPENPESPEPSVVSEVINLVGFEDLDPEEFDDSVEGLGKLVQTASEKLAEQQLGRTFEQHPEVKEFFEYVQNGGDPNRYHEARGQAVDYQSMEVAEDNETQQEQLIRASLTASDYEKEEIDGIVEKYKAGGILKDQAEIALKGLKRQTAKKHEKLVEQQAAQAKERETEIKTYWDNVSNTIKEQDNFKGIQIPKKERTEFYEYISKPVKDGYSQRDLDALELGLEEKIAIDYLIYKGFPLSDIVDKKAASKAASDLRKRIKSGGDPKPSKTAPPKPKGSGEVASVADLDLM